MSDKIPDELLHPAVERVVGSEKIRPCGPCALCCKVAIVPEMKKPGGIWCEKASPGRGGCSIYHDPARPKVCRTFLCVWAERDNVLPDAMRPDRVHAYVTGLVGQEGLCVHVDPEHRTAWQEGILGVWIKHMIRRGLKIVVRVGQRRHFLLGGQWVTTVDARRPDAAS